MCWVRVVGRSKRTNKRTKQTNKQASMCYAAAECCERETCAECSARQSVRRGRATAQQTARSTNAQQRQKIKRRQSKQAMSKQASKKLSVLCQNVSHPPLACQQRRSGALKQRNETKQKAVPMETTKPRLCYSSDRNRTIHHGKLCSVCPRVLCNYGSFGLERQVCACAQGRNNEGENKTITKEHRSSSTT